MDVEPGIRQRSDNTDPHESRKWDSGGRTGELFKYWRPFAAATDRFTAGGRYRSPGALVKNGPVTELLYCTQRTGGYPESAMAKRRNTAGYRGIPHTSDATAGYGVGFPPASGAADKR